MQNVSNEKSPVMYYDPYEECPEMLTQPRHTKSAADSSPVDENSRTMNGTSDETLKLGTGHFEQLVESSSRFEDNSPSDDKYSTAPRNFVNVVNGVVRTDPAVIDKNAGFHDILVTANSAYCPPSDYANPAELLNELNIPVGTDEQFHDANTDLNTEFSGSNTQNDIRKPVPAPRTSKSAGPPVPAAVEDDGPLYDEPWDLNMRRLALEDRFRAAVGEDDRENLVENTKLGVKYSPTSENKAAELRALNRLSNPNLGSDGVPYDTQQCGLTWSVGVRRSDEAVAGGPGVKQEESSPHKKDGRGEEGYDKPWDLKPHLKDDRPAMEYDAPWDHKNPHNLMTSSVITSRGDRPASPFLPAVGAASRGHDARPGIDYDRPWDQKIQQNNSSSARSKQTMVQPIEPRTAVIPPLKSDGTLPQSGTAGATDTVNPKVPLELQSWYHGVISRQDAEVLLRALPEGSFLVRTSESNRLAFSLSVKSANGFMHMKIVNEGCRYILGQFSQPFYTIPQMIHHYAKHKLPIKGAEHISLIHPVSNDLL